MVIQVDVDRIKALTIERYGSAELLAVALGLHPSILSRQSSTPNIGALPPQRSANG